MKRKSLLSLMLLCFAFFGVARAEVVEIGSGTTGNSYLPTYSFYNYSLTQQIYPACEIGTAGTINSIAFHNVGTSAKTRTLDVYFVLTDKSSFSGATDWITVTASDLVYSGSVTFPASDWVTLTLNTPFTLDGTNNLAVIVDDNTGSYSSGLSCATFDASGMAIRVYSDGTNYNPLAPTSYTGTVMNVKNCIRLDITPDPSVTLCCPPDAITVPTEGITAHEAVVNWEGGAAPYNVEYKKTTDTEWTVGATGVTGSTTTLTGLAQNTAYQARVQSGCGGSWITSANFTTLVSVVAPTGLTCTGTTTTSATLSWTENGAATSWIVAYKASGEENFTEVTVSENPCTITGLTHSTTYTAKVCAVVNGERSSWSSTISFITACDTYTAPYEYGFEDAGPFTCWTPFNTGTARSTSYPHGGSYSLRFSGTTSNLIALPQFTNATNTLALDFWTRPESNTNNSCGTFDVGYMTDLEDATSFVAIETYSYNDWASATYLEKYVPLNTAPADAYIAFRHNAGATNWYWFVDDISVIEIPDCAKPTGLAASNPFGHGATLRWISEASEWVVAYKTAEAENFTEITGVTENPYTIDGLDPETDYIAKVRANCDGTLSDWSSAVSFTTTVACLAPTGLAATLTAGDGSVATLNWTSEATEWVVAYKNADDEEFREVNVTEKPYTLTNLTPEMTVNAKVKAVCGGEDGESEWSSVITFTPTDSYFITVNDGTNTNSYVPVYGLWVDSHSKSQFIIPADGLADMQWGIINKMTFHASTASTDWGAAMFEVYVTEVNYTAFETASLVDWTSMTKVMNAGSLAISGNKMEVTLDTPYQYMGGNLLIGILETTPGTYQSCSWYGVSSENNVALGGYESSKAISFQTFLPKTTFEYTPGEAPDCIPPTGLAVDYTGGTTATVSWTSDATAWNMTLNGVAVEGPITNPYTLTNLELGTKYVVSVQADCGSSQSDWVTTDFTTDDCMPEDMLVINYTLTDSYGDGWNGNYILVIDASCNIAEALTISSGGSTATGTLKICGGYAQFLWYNGSYPDETSWVFTDSEGNVLFQGEGNDDMANYDVLYTIDSNPVAAPSDIMASEVGPHSAKLSWTENGTATAWQIMLNEDEENIIDANTNPFVLTGLDPETEYFVQVRAVTATGTSMWPCVGGGFTTDVPCPAPEVSVTPYPTTAEVTMEGWAETYDIEMLQYSYTPSADALWLQYDDGTFATNIGNEGNYIWTWGVMYPASMLTNSNYLNKIAVYEIANYYTMANYTVEIYTGGDDAPGTLVHTESVAPAGIDGFHEVMLSSPVTIDPTQNLWITVTATGSYVLAACETTEANNQWVLSEDEEGNEIWANIGDLASSLAGYGWMIRGYIDNIAPDMNWTSVASGVASPYTLEGLDPETTYSIRVKALCGGEDGESEWTPTVTFTTPAACDAPNTLTATDVTGNSATLNWIGYQDRFNVRYRTTGYDEYSFFEDFENGLPSTWTTIDADGDGNTWYGIKQDNFAQYCHSGTGLVTSASYANSALTPDNWLVTPQIELQGTMKVWMRAQDPDWAEEHYAIYLSTTGNTVDDFTTVLVAETYDLTGEYIAVTADLSAYAGQQGYIAIRHFNCTDMFRINVDDFGIVTSSIEPGEWIDATADEETLAISGLTPETEYEWQVQGVNCDGEGTNTEWSEMATFTTGEQTNLTQTVALAASTNWFSTYVEITLEDLQAALDAVNTNNKAITIKTQNANSNYIPRTHRWSTPASFIWDVANMYQIVLTEACEITLEGAPIDPLEHPITIAGGGDATWIGFPFSESMTLTNAFAALPPTNGDVVRYQSANAAYARNRWSTAIANLEPGKGYIYVSAASAGDRTLVFPTNAKRAAKGNVINPSDNSASSAISFPTDARKAAKVIDLNLNVKNTAKDTPYRIMKKAIKGVAKTVDETLTEIIK